MRVTVRTTAGRDRIRRGSALIAALVCTMTTGCGSLLSDQELAQTGPALVGSERPASGGDQTAAGGPSATGGIHQAGGPEPTVAPGTDASGNGALAGAAGSGSSGGPSAGTSGALPGASATSPRTPGAARDVGPSGRPAPAASVPAAGASPAPTGSNPNAPAPPAQGGAPVRLGSFGQMSGPLGAIFIGMVHAAKAWVADVNTRGGLNGHAVTIKFIDDGADPGRALAAARRLAEEDKVVAFYPTPAAFTLEGALGYIEQHKIPVLAACNCNSAADSSPMVFDVGPHAPLGNAWFYILAAKKFAPERHKAAIFYCAEAKTCPTIADTIQKSAGEAGVDIVYKAQVSLAAPDYTAEVIAARSAGADVGYAILDNPSQARLLSTAKRQGWDAAISGNHAPYEERFLKFGDAVDGMLTSSQVVPWSSSPLMADYREAMDRYVPGGVKGALGANSWITGKLLEKISTGFGTGEVTSEQILTGLYGLDRETLGGRMPPTTYLPGVGHKEANLCVYPVKVSKGAFVTSDDYICAPHWKPVVRSAG